MNILVIGNGFDLAHGLPTKYTDFVNYLRILNTCMENCEEGKDTNLEDIKEYQELQRSCKDKLNEFIYRPIFPYDEVRELVCNNFLIKNLHIGIMDKWVDFEKELSDIVKDIHIKQLRSAYIRDILSETNLSGIKLEEVEELESVKDSYIDVAKEKLLKDLNELIDAFERYLRKIVSRIEIENTMPDISELIVDKLISFNYTNTYRKIYEKLSDEDCHFIHGEVIEHRLVFENNIVIGIDDFEDNIEKNYDIEFIEFKKFYQRILKKTGNKYIQWLITHDDNMHVIKNKIDQEKSEQRRKELQDEYDRNKLIEIYFFGHSLDVSDRDIISKLILNPYAKTTIFYVNSMVQEQQIMNLVKIIGKDKLIEKTGEGLLEFVRQKDPIYNVESNTNSPEHNSFEDTFNAIFGGSANIFGNRSKGDK